MSRDLVGRKARVKIRNEWVEGTVARVEQPRGDKDQIVEVHFPINGSDPVRYGARRKLEDVKLD